MLVVAKSASEVGLVVVLRPEINMNGLWGQFWFNFFNRNQHICITMCLGTQINGCFDAKIFFNLATASNFNLIMFFRFVHNWKCSKIFIFRSKRVLILSVNLKPLKLRIRLWSRKLLFGWLNWMRLKTRMERKSFVVPILWILENQNLLRCLLWKRLRNHPLKKMKVD